MAFRPSDYFILSNDASLSMKMDLNASTVSLSAFHHRTYNSYMASNVYTPFNYNYTPVSSIETALTDIKDNYIKKEYIDKGSKLGQASKMSFLVK